LILPCATQTAKPGHCRVGYSGGKDSIAVLQLVWLAIRELPAEQRTKPIHVITTDTLVEQPMVAAWVDTSQARMREAAQAQGLPITPHKLTPEIEDSFWVNLIGKGYPAPRLKFRWCTERLKTKPSNKFICEVVRSSGEAILVLGTRKAESALRAASMARRDARRVRERLSPVDKLPKLLVYRGRGGHHCAELGHQRLGCWVCTVAEQDELMAATSRRTRLSPFTSGGLLRRLRRGRGGRTCATNLVQGRRLGYDNVQRPELVGILQRLDLWQQLGPLLAKLGTEQVIEHLQR